MKETVRAVAKAKPVTKGVTVPETRDMMVARVCGHEVVRPKRGPEPGYCGARCRKAASRAKG